jgi:hypothetical protein
VGLRRVQPQLVLPPPLAPGERHGAQEEPSQDRPHVPGVEPLSFLSIRIEKQQRNDHTVPIGYDKTLTVSSQCPVVLLCYCSYRYMHSVF